MSGEWGAIETARVILATGGRSLPKTGSDGSGYALAEALGHTPTPRTLPALVPLLLPQRHLLLALAGVSVPVRLSVRAGTQKHVATCRGFLLCTHFGVSGPAVLDISRHWLLAHSEDAGARLVCDWLPESAGDELDMLLRAPGAGTVTGRLRRHLPERLVRVVSEIAAVDPDLAAARLARDDRKRLVAAFKEMVLPVTGDRGWTYAEVTAGGIPLAQLNLTALESRVCPGLHLCGEICDVDGRIGGFNFQWAWASGYVAGFGAARLLAGEHDTDADRAV